MHGRTVDVNSPALTWLDASDSLPLFEQLVPCQVFVPDATATKDPAVLPMFEFVGKLMGMAIRSKNPLDLNLSSIVWKPLVGLPVTRDDIEDIHDGCFEVSLQYVT